jgi:hypothetical protein
MLILRKGDKGGSNRIGAMATRAELNWRRIAWLTLFAVAMGLLEAVVVVYLRELYYPEGFRFPVILAPVRIAVAELLREAATLLMLLAVAMVAGRGGFDRFSVFAYLFGMWDIVYYAALLLLLGWPDSLLEWDVLFLIPVPWLSPVLYPILISCFLVALFFLHEILTAGGRALRLSLPEWLVASAGGLVVILSFCWNWRLVLEGGIPDDFPEALFAAGLLMGVIPFARALLRALRG